MKERVLLVDDEPQVLVALEDLLSDEFVIYKADSAQKALTVVRAEPDIAVVVTDQRMPQMSGDELLARLGDTSDASRILVTGFADLSAVVRAVNEGKIFAYITKPWNGDDLRVKVAKAAEHFRLAKELAHERNLLHDLMNNVPDGIYFKDRELRFQRVNRAFAALMNAREPEYLAGRRLEELRSVAIDDHAIESEERRVLQEGAPLLDVLREYTSGGERRWLSETKAPIFGSHGEVIGLVGISRDVTRQRLLEQQFLQAQKMEAIGQLAGGVAHDFNNLLAVIQSYSALVINELGEEDPMRADISEILAASRRGSSLTRQLLAFSRQQITQPKVANLNAIVADVQNMLRRIIGEHIALDTALSEDLGLVRIDVGQVEQVIVNLTVNSRDAMPEGGKLTIETSNVQIEQEFAAQHSGVSPGEFVMLAVTDTGAGIDPETQKHIFEPFFTTKEVGKGTGLGLSTVHGIVQQSGGFVTVYSQLARGTSFKVYFPRIREHGGSSTAHSKSSPPVAKTKAGAILVVEDDEAVRQVAARILRAGGYTVLEARRATEATSICNELSGKIDLLLTDVVMPGQSGEKLAAELCQTWPRIRVLFMSGYPGAAVARDGLVASGTAYIEKPFSPSALLAKVEETLTALGVAHPHS
ncbi:MAG TPA: response regulator [Polyangiaceae bacterium]